MNLESMEPNPDWDASEYEAAVDTVREFADDITVTVWGADWCPDCTGQLPDVAAFFEAAGVAEDQITDYPVEREDGEKYGPKVEEYGIELIPTIVIERDGTEIARFVEEADVPAYVSLAEQLAAIEA